MKTKSKRSPNSQFIFKFKFHSIPFSVAKFVLNHLRSHKRTDTSTDSGTYSLWEKVDVARLAARAATKAAATCNNLILKLYSNISVHNLWWQKSWQKIATGTEYWTKIDYQNSSGSLKGWKGKGFRNANFHKVSKRESNRSWKLHLKWLRLYQTLNFFLLFSYLMDLVVKSFLINDFFKL